MTFGKRAFDAFFGLLLAVILSPLICVLLAALLIIEGRPLFYVSERMKTPSRPFALIKLRTMRPGPFASNGGVSGGDKAARIGAFGRFLRKSRLDELPQLANIVRGDMSFVGPRPPLRQYVEKFPEVYANVLVCRPGVTGMATLFFHTREERLLAACATAQETDQMYCRCCIARKARLDRIYARHASLRLDLWILGKTVAKLARV